VSGVVFLTRDLFLLGEGIRLLMLAGIDLAIAEGHADTGFAPHHAMEPGFAQEALDGAAITIWSG